MTPCDAYTERLGSHYAADWTCYGHITTCLPETKYEQNANQNLLGKVLRPKKTPCDAYTTQLNLTMQLYWKFVVYYTIS